MINSCPDEFCTRLSLCVTNQNLTWSEKFNQLHFSRLKNWAGIPPLLTSTMTVITSGNSTRGLSENLVNNLGTTIQQIKTTIRTFSDGESKITLDDTITGDRVVVVQSLFPPVDTNLLQTLLLVSKAREVSTNVDVVIPYMGYARQDREFLPGEIVTMNVIGKLFKSVGTSRIIIVDIHSMEGLKHLGTNTRNVTAIPDLARYFTKEIRIRDPMVVSPDLGGAARAGEFASHLDGSGCVILQKKRDRRTGTVTITTEEAAEVRGRDIILVDDMISTGSSIINATQFLKMQGCGDVYVACTHALLVGDAAKQIQKAGATRIISTNTIPGSTSVVDVSDVIAKAVLSL